MTAACSSTIRDSLALPGGEPLVSIRPLLGAIDTSLCGTLDVCFAPASGLCTQDAGCFVLTEAEG